MEITAVNPKTMENQSQRRRTSQDPWEVVRVRGMFSSPHINSGAPMKCPKCDSQDVDRDPTRGDSTCRNCGHVLEENTIVSEVSFTENPAGASSVVGQFVPTTGPRAYSGSIAPTGFAKRTREETDRRLLGQIAVGLNLSSHYVDSAHRCFKLAVQYNFIQGRRTQDVMAACLYLVCRLDKLPHMLIDFADTLQVNVYTLGRVFRKLHRFLQLGNNTHYNVPYVDPSLYIDRFAAKLEFGEKTHDVALSALRIMASMKREWLFDGRRPSGLVGAALLVAARAHGFMRTKQEVIRVVRTCDSTLNRRLQELISSKTGSMTGDEFAGLDIERSDIHGLPPSFVSARQREKMLELHQATGTSALDALDPADKSLLLNAKVYDLDDELDTAPEEGTLDENKSQNPHPGNGRMSSPAGASQDPLSTAADADDPLASVKDEDVAEYFVPEDQVRLRTVAWEAEFKDFMEKRELKRKLNASSASGSKKRKATTLARTPAEAAARQSWSSKVNYQVLHTMWGTQSGVASSSSAQPEG